MKTFTCSYSKGIKISTTISVVVILIAIALSIVELYNTKFSDYRIWIALIIIILGIALVFPFFYQIKDISLDDEHLVINRIFGHKIILLKDIDNVREKTGEGLDLRLFGIGGLFGYYGLFWNRDIGVYRACANNGNNLIAIKTKCGKTYVISCDDRDSLIEELSKLSVGTD